MKFLYRYSKPYKILILFLFSLQFSVAFSQQSATTDTGEEVILEKNGTWKYAKSSDIDIYTLDTNATVFQKDIEATFLLKSKKNKSAIYLNPKKWKFKKADLNQSSEYEFEAINQNSYGVMINEKVELPLQTLIKFVMNNARKALKVSIEIEKQEFRIVNDKVVLCLVMKGKSLGVSYVYISYYFASENGSTQLNVFTSQKLLKETQSLMEELLNGLIFIE